MIDLNFINPEEQTDFRREKLVLFLRDLILISLISAAIISSMLLGGKNELQKSMAEITDSGSGLKTAQNNISIIVKRVNKRLQEIDKIQKDYTPWSGIIAQIAASVPKGNKLSELSLNIEQNTIQLKGISNTRGNLLEMKKIFEQHPLVKNVEMPISNLLSKTDIIFKITITLK